MRISTKEKEKPLLRCDETKRKRKRKDDEAEKIIK